MEPATSSLPEPPLSHRPRMAMVFAAAFVAGAAAAVGANSVLDAWRTQSKPQVASEPIFVALRSMPQGAPVTVWDVGLRNWPTAMLPATAIRAEETFEGCVLRHPLREGQPLLSGQLVRPEGPAGGVAQVADPFALAAADAPASRMPTTPDADLWASSGSAAGQPAGPTPRSTQRKPTSADVAPPASAERTPVVAGSASETGPVTGQPAPNEPTPADTAVPAPAAEGEPPLVSVMKPAAQPKVAPADGPEADTGKVVRYLVVPERIAREVDALFAAAAGTEEREADQGTTPATMPQTGSRSGRQSVAPVRPAAPQMAGTGSPRPASPAAQPQRPGRQPVAGQPKASPRQSQAPINQPMPPARRGSVDQPRTWQDVPATRPDRQRRFGAVMSSITSGLEAMAGGGRKQSPRPSDYDEAVATDQPDLLPVPLPR